MNIVFKVSDNIKEKMINYYKPYYKEKTPPYAIFQAMQADTVITLYESGKAMFQGISADIDAAIWIDLEKKLNNRVIDISGSEKKKDKPKESVKKTFLECNTIGSDEVGTGDYFGPIVVTASYVDKSMIPFLIDLGVRDSKKLTDDKIISIAPLIIKNIPYTTFILDNLSYNNLSTENKNMNKIKAILHNKVLVNLIKKNNYPYEKIVIDQFVYPKKFYEHIKGAKEQITNVTFMTKAEDQVLSVACASIISRYIFLNEINKMSKELNKKVPLGAGSDVDLFAKELLANTSLENLKKYVKLNFKNTQKILDMENQ